MKKKIVKALLSAAVITTMLFSVTACGAKNDDIQDAGADAVSSVAAQQEDTEPAAATAAADGDDVQESTVTDTEEAATTDVEQLTVSSNGDMTLEEWTKSDECAQFSEMMNAGLDGMVISFEVEGDTISMIFTMEEALDVAEDAEEAMNEYFTSNAAIFEAIRDQLISETGNENTVLRLIYRNADDSEIFSMDF